MGVVFCKSFNSLIPTWALYQHSSRYSYFSSTSLSCFMLDYARVLSCAPSKYLSVSYYPLVFWPSVAIHMHSVTCRRSDAMSELRAMA